MIAGTHGVDLRLKLSADLTGYTDIELVIFSPSCIRTVVTATAFDVETGIISYITEENVFNLHGTHKLQAIITFASKLLKSKVVDLIVEKSL